MKHTRILFLIALVAGLGLMPGWELTSGAQTCQQEGACFVIRVSGLHHQSQHRPDNHRLPCYQQMQEPGILCGHRYRRLYPRGAR